VMIKPGNPEPDLSPIVFFDNRKHIEAWVYHILAELKFAPQVYFITNSPRRKKWSRFPNVTFLPTKDLDYKSTFEQFISSYVHLSTNSEAFELSCFERFFALNALMQRKGLTRAWHLDPDVWAKDSLIDIQRAGKSQTILSRLEPRNGATSAHCAHFTGESVMQFTDFLSSQFYQRHGDALKTQFLQRISLGLRGGVTDMQALDYWLDSDDSVSWSNSETFIASHPAINHALVEEFQTSNPQGKDHFRLLSKPHDFKITFPDGSSKSFCSIHFQGMYKSLVPRVKRLGVVSGTRIHWKRILWWSGKRYNFFRILRSWLVE
jgi:hypothetical protein